MTNRINPAAGQNRRPAYKPEMGTFWWSKQGRYVSYIAREVSSFFTAITGIFLVIGLSALAGGPNDWDVFLNMLQGTGTMLILMLCLIFGMWHTITWFQLAPKAMPLEFADQPVPPKMITLGHWAVWVIVSLFVFIVISGG